MKIYAIINWEEDSPQITAVDGFPMVAMSKALLEKMLSALEVDNVSRTLKKRTAINYRIVEFESVQDEKSKLIVC